MQSNRQHPKPRPSTSRNLVAGFVLFHVVAVCLMAFPAPQAAQRRTLWKDASVQNEMHQWADRARAIGMDFTDESFQDFLWELSVDLLDIRKKILAPFTPYLSAVGAKQSWRMFSAPHRYPSRLVIDVRNDGKWQTVYEGRSEKYRWQAAILDHHRMRRVAFMFGWKKKTGSWRRFTQFLARRAAADFPSASMIRVSLRKFQTPSPEQRRGGIREVKPHRTLSSKIKLETFRK